MRLGRARILLLGLLFTTAVTGIGANQVSAEADFVNPSKCVVSLSGTTIRVGYLATQNLQDNGQVNIWSNGHIIQSGPVTLEQRDSPAAYFDDEINSTPNKIHFSIEAINNNPNDRRTYCGYILGTELQTARNGQASGT